MSRETGKEPAESMDGERRLGRGAAFFDDPFADFEHFFGRPGEREPDDEDQWQGALAPAWSGAFGMMTPLRRLARGLGRSFDEAFRQAEELSRAPPADGQTHCYCSATSEVLLPGGAHEVRHTSRDSRTGKELALHSREVDGRRVTERRERDLRTGVEERRQDLLNVDEQALADFDSHWASLFPARDAPRALPK